MCLQGFLRNTTKQSLQYLLLPYLRLACPFASCPASIYTVTWTTPLIVLVAIEYVPLPETVQLLFEGLRGPCAGLLKQWRQPPEAMQLRDFRIWPRDGWRTGARLNGQGESSGRRVGDDCG